MTRRRYIVRPNCHIGLALNDKPDWAVYDTQRDDEWPIAVFARRDDARAWAALSNKP